MRTIVIKLLAGALLMVHIHTALCAHHDPEIIQAVHAGVKWLNLASTKDPRWWPQEQPAITGLALTARANEPQLTAEARRFTEQGFSLFQQKRKPDGGVYHTNYITYNTAWSII